MHSKYLIILVVQLIFLVVYSDAEGECPPGWYQSQTHCFFIAPKETIWSDARTLCQTTQAALSAKIKQVLPAAAGGTTAAGGLEEGREVQLSSRSHSSDYNYNVNPNNGGGECQLWKQKGVDPYGIDIYGFTPLHYASQNHIYRNNRWRGGNDATRDVQALLRCYEEDGRLAEMVAKTTYTHNTALCSAAYRGSASIVRLLLDAGSDIEHRCVKYAGMTPLLRATMYNELSVVKALLDAGSDITAVDDHGKSLMFYAEHNRDNNPRRPEVLNYIRAKNLIRRW